MYTRVVRLSKPRIVKADRFLRRFGGLPLILARFAASLRVVVMPLAVSRGMSYGRFLAFDFLGALLWSAGFVWLGRAAGALGGRGGVAGTVAVVGVLAIASTAMAVLARRRFAGRVSVS